MVNEENPIKGNELKVEEEIAGGLKNAVERGQDLEKAMMSFASAGYDIAKINLAAKIASGAQPIAQPTQSAAPVQPGQVVTQPITQPTPGGKPLPTTPGVASKKSNKKFIIIFLVIAALILVFAGLLGMYWPKLFP